MLFSCQNNAKRRKPHEKREPACPCRRRRRGTRGAGADRSWKPRQHGLLHRLLSSAISRVPSGLHSAAKVQYVRPEIIGLVLGAFVDVASCGRRVPRARGLLARHRASCSARSSMIGALVFLGCPLRMVLRLGGGDLNAAGRSARLRASASCIGIVVPAAAASTSSAPTRPARSEGGVLPAVMTGLLLLVLLVPSVLHLQGSEEAPARSTRRSGIALVIARRRRRARAEVPPVHGRRHPRRDHAQGRRTCCAASSRSSPSRSTGNLVHRQFQARL